MPISGPAGMRPPIPTRGPTRPAGPRPGTITPTLAIPLAGHRLPTHRLPACPPIASSPSWAIARRPAGRSHRPHRHAGHRLAGLLAIASTPAGHRCHAWLLPACTPEPALPRPFARLPAYLRSWTHAPSSESGAFSYPGYAVIAFLCSFIEGKDGARPKEYLEIPPNRATTALESGIQSRQTPTNQGQGCPVTRRSKP